MLTAYLNVGWSPPSFESADYNMELARYLQQIYFTIRISYQ